MKTPAAFPSALMLCTLAVSVLLSALITWLLVRHWGGIAMDNPDGRRKIQDRPIPRVGGFPIFLTLMAGCVFSVFHFDSFLEHWWPIILCNSLIFAIGFLDDVRPLGARIKLLGQVGAACILYSRGVSIDVLSNPFGEGGVDLGWWSFPITVIWLIAVPNIINLIDGMDGLASGFGLFMCLTLAFVGHHSLSPETVLLSVVMSGAMVGFLFFNFPPARIYLGDGGAYLLGFYLASVSLHSSHKGSIIAGILVMIVALGVPILDTLFAILRRVIRGVPVFRADAEHIHHRLILLGFSKTKALIAMYSVCLALSLVGMSILMTKGKMIPIMAGPLFLLALGAARYLGYIKKWSDLPAQVNAALNRRRDMLYTATYGKVLEWEADRCDDETEFIDLFDIAMRRVGFATQQSNGLKPMELPLVTGEQCVLYCKCEADSRERWLAKADLFLPALNVAITRWKKLPGLEINEVNK